MFYVYLQICYYALCNNYDEREAFRNFGMVSWTFQCVYPLIET